MKAGLNLFVARLGSLPAALLLIVNASASAATCTPPPSGIVGWWRAEGNANDAADSNNGTIAGTGTVSYGPGVVGQALVFDGTHRDRVNLGNPTDLQLQDFTIEAWVKRSSPTVTSFDVLGADGSVAGDGAVILGYGRGGYGFALANDGRMIISRIDLDGIYSAPLVTDTSWHHLAVTKSGSTAVFYLDGMPQATPAYDHPAPYTFDDATCSCSAAIAIGSRGDARGGTFFGAIDEVAIYNRPLSAAEIQAIYNAGSAGKCEIPPAPTIETLIELLDNANLPANTRRELGAILQAAAASFERGQAQAGINQLGAFENKVRAQIARSNPVLAQELIDATQGIINALGAR
jgi:hypothetical protein